MTSVNMVVSYTILMVLITMVHGKPARRRDPMINEGMFQGDILGVIHDGDRVVTSDPNRLWPDGVVPYVMDKTMPEDMAILIPKGMAAIEKASCIKFVKREGKHKDYVRIISGDGCYSNLGRTGGAQKLSLGGGCENTNTVIHEVLHALGFAHEHSSPKRDEYIEILYDNIREDQYDSFEKLKQKEFQLLTPFDFDSLMLYGSFNGFAIDSSMPTMRRWDGTTWPDSDDKPGLSKDDIFRINTLYRCKQ